jgi:hypothetical protein
LLDDYINKSKTEFPTFDFTFIFMMFKEELSTEGNDNLGITKKDVGTSDDNLKFKWRLEVRQRSSALKRSLNEVTDYYSS